MTSEILKDLKIVELASVLAGPSVGMFFAELGAKVIKFENALTDGDVTRTWKLPSENPDEVSAYFASINWGKTYHLVNYNLKEDLQKVKDAIADADIVICNFKKGLAARFSLDYQTLKAANDKLIYAQLDGFAYEDDRVAFDVVLQAECGYMYMNGQPESPPTKMPLALMDILAAHQLKEGILTALLKRYKTNKGSLVVCSLEKSAIASLVNQASNYLMVNHIPNRMGSLHPNIAPYGEVFQTEDNADVVLAIGSDRQFEKFCEILKVDFFSDDKFTTNKQRVTNRKLLFDALKLPVQKWNSDDLIKECISLQVPIGKVKNMEEVFASETGKAMILEEDIEGTHTRRVRSVGFEVV